MKIKKLLNDGLTWLFVFEHAISLGATVYQMMVLVPEWNRDRPNGMIAFAHSQIETANFWRAPFLGIIFLLCIIAVVLNWRTKRRNWLLLSYLTGIVAAVITYAYFVPMLSTMGLLNHQPSADLALLSKTIKAWTLADQLRFWILLVPGFFFALKAATIQVNYDKTKG